MNNKVFIVMKLIITEEQLKKVKLITEGQEVVHTFMSKSDEIKDILNRLYSKLSFSTLSELIEGDVDLDVIGNKIDQLRTVLYTHYKKSEMFFNSIPEDEFDNDNNWWRLQEKMEDTYQLVSYKKIDGLEDLVDSLKTIVESEVEEYFKDIKKLDI